jgi:hypothetical protein
VTNVVGRADLLAAFGVLTGLLCHVRSASAAGRRKNAWRVGLVAAGAVGFFSKESAAVLPGLMLFYDLAWSKRGVWRERAVNYAALAVPAAIYLYLRTQMQAHTPYPVIPFGDNPLVGADFWTAGLTAIKVIGKDLWLLFWPGRLSADYSYNAIPLFGWRWSWEDAKALIALAVCVALATLALRSYRREKRIGFFIAWFFVTVAPTANLFLPIGSIMAERFLYLPALGVIGCVVAVLETAGWRWESRWAWAALGVILLACAGRTFARNSDWRDERSLWTSTAKGSPDSYKAHWQLAVALLNTGPSQLDGAVQEADRTMAILESLPPEAQTPMPYAESALCYRAKGDSLGLENGGPWYRKALAALLRGQQVDAAATEAMREANLARGKNMVLHSWASLYLELGRVYLRLKQPDQALAALAVGRARQANPEFSEEMARAWFAKSDWQHAAVAVMEGIVLNPGASNLAGELLEIYHREAPQSCAAANSTINMQCPLVHDQLCEATRNVALEYQRNAQAGRANATVRTAVQQLACPAELFR